MEEQQVSSESEDSMYKEDKITVSRLRSEFLSSVSKAEDSRA